MRSNQTLRYLSCLESDHRTTCSTLSSKDKGVRSALVSSKESLLPELPSRDFIRENKLLVSQRSEKQRQMRDVRNPRQKKLGASSSSSFWRRQPTLEQVAEASRKKAAEEQRLKQVADMQAQIVLLTATLARNRFQRQVLMVEFQRLPLILDTDRKKQQKTALEEEIRQFEVEISRIESTLLRLQGNENPYN